MFCFPHHQRSYVFTFLLSSRLFLHPYELMTRVCHLCVEQQRSGDTLLDKVGGLHAHTHTCAHNYNTVIIISLHFTLPHKLTHLNVVTLSHPQTHTQPLCNSFLGENIYRLFHKQRNSSQTELFQTDTREIKVKGTHLMETIK